MRKLFIYLMAGVLSASLLTGCGGNGNTGDSQQAAQEDVQVSTEAEVVYPTGELMTPEVLLQAEMEVRKVLMRFLTQKNYTEWLLS